MANHLATLDRRLSSGDCRLPALLISLLVLAIAARVDAQVIQRPERAARGPARTPQELRITLNSLGGYDDNPALQESGGLDVFTARDPGYTGFADAALRYWREREGHSLEVSGRGYLNSFRNVGLKPNYGADLQANMRTALGRRHQLDLAGAARNDPYYAVGAFALLRGDVGAGVLPDANPVNGSYARRSVGSDAAVSLVSRWSSRTTATVTYRYDMRDFRDDIGDGHRHAASLEYMRTFGRRTGLRALYRRSDSEFSEMAGITQPITEDSGELGYQYERTFSPTRRWLFSFGGGAMYVTTLSRLTREPLQYRLPSGYGSTRLDVARTWSIWADYRRGLSVLEGLTVQSFVTDAAMVRFGGFAGSRSEIVVSAGYSNGAAAPGSTGSLENYTATAQLRYRFTPSWSALISHAFYAYRLSGVADLPLGFADSLNRNALRVGMTLALPVYSSSRARPPATAGRN